MDDRLIPIPIIPEQDMTPWFAALERLTSDQEHYKRTSHEAKEAADFYLSKINPNDLINHLTAFANRQESVPDFKPIN
ncbi:hypothetical protein [Paenibacillus hexagrammi]|uniref:Uncharacterized protein n=1 Tax=Paenibacillus hexagrammi TaxID=2908839 RepID=A0ABY3SCZ0_9BACL|nr:hypothetical protein [Paenibacillus sp. YPD9-1]UJF31859.1 hypothetical protein L0M14_19130 [Paenibacillus sp. YPD9-1]